MSSTPPALIARYGANAAPAEADLTPLIEQLLAAMSARDSRLALLETMAAEDLPLDWHEQQAQRLSTLTFEDLRPWLKP